MRDSSMKDVRGMGSLKERELLWKIKFILNFIKWKQWATIAVSGFALWCPLLLELGVSADEQVANQVTSASTPE